MLKKLYIILFCFSLLLTLSACGGSGGGQTNQPPSITTQPSNISIVAGNNATFSVSANGTNLNYQWQVDSGSGFANISDTGIYSGSTTTTLTLANVTTSMNGYKYKVVVNGAVSPSAISNNATLSVTPATQAVISVSIAGLPQAGISTGIIAFTLKIPDLGVIPTGLIGNDAIAAVSFGPNLSAGFSGVTYDSTTHEISFGGLNSSGTQNGRLLDITCDIASGTIVNKSDFAITIFSVDDVNTSYTATSSLPLNVIFK